MREQLKHLGVWAVGVVFLAAGCSRGPSRVHPPSIDAGEAGTAAMAEYDTDKDGKVAGAELDKAPSLKAALANLDRDGDKAVSAEEVTERIKVWQGSKLGDTSVTVTVQYRGQPLAGASVVFEPEKFLGPNVKPGNGTTDQRGMTGMKAEGLAGMAPGLYKVKITKQGMTLPAMYNEQTVLGAEVANDAAEAMEGGPTFRLQ